MIWAGLAAINTGIKAVAYNESIYGRLLGMQFVVPSITRPMILRPISLELIRL